MNTIPELMRTTLPPPWARITGITACIVLIGPNTLRWKICQNYGIDLLYGGRVAAPRIVYQPVG